MSPLELVVFSLAGLVLITGLSSAVAFQFCGKREAWLRLSILNVLTVTLAVLGFRWSGWLGIVVLPALMHLFFWTSIALVARYLFPVTNTRHWLQATRVLASFVFDCHLSSYHIDRGEIAHTIRGQLMTRWGAGVLLIRPGSAAVLETPTRFSRVLGPGVHFLRRGEYVKRPIDLHVQLRTDVVKATTKDAVPLEIPLFCLFRIKPDGGGRSARDFAFSEDNLRRAVYGPEGISQDGDYRWDRYAFEVNVTRFREILARIRLDQLFDAERPDHVPRPVLTDLLHAAARADLSRQGIDLLNVGFGAVGFIQSVQGQILDQRIQSWETEWRARADSTLAAGAAEAERQVQSARASAQWHLIQGLINGLTATQGLQDTDPVDLVTWQLLTAMESMSADPMLYAAVSRETMSSMLAIRNWLETRELT
jgi:regulator of protease activity HflC (stomatin/prohibitin superfamily)